MFRGFAVLAALVFAVPALAQAPSPAPTSPAAVDALATLTVTGTGEVFVAPDIATLRIGVESRAETAAEAVAGNNEAAQRVIATLKESGIAAQDIQTANFSVSPVYDDRSHQRREGPRIIGYQATNQVVARIHDLDGLGAVLDATVTSGANRIDSLSFGLDDDAEAMDEARRRAVRAARRKADVYVEAAGVTLGDIRSISEGGWARPMPMQQDVAFRAEAASAVPIERGQNRMAAQVQVVWEILPSVR